ncbi:CU044_5270 family protein [Streptomyces monashensis]|uniref:CU044_5270 family protein n=1 Tax=Streptomyces monashensis TaxID=1678012 RepID=UPI0033FF1075
MNTDDHGPERAEREELARLLPVPVDRDLRPGRHDHHKDILMQEIDRDGVRSTRPRRLLRPALVLPAAALALAGACAVALLGTGTGARPAARPPAGQDTGAHVLLDRIANAASASDATPVRDDQFVYVRSLQTTNEGAFGGRVKLGAPHQREVWTAQISGPTRERGLLREGGQDVPIEEGVPDGTDPSGHPGTPAGIDRPTYRWLAALPTDPAALLRRLESGIRPVPGQEKAQTVFIRIGDLLQETVLPPRTAAALYQAAARLPGVTRIADAVDAAGRHGIAVAREDAKLGERTEWIFDRSSLAFIGERAQLTRDSARGTAGTPTQASAVLERAVVDAAGQEPKHDPGTQRRA